MKFYHCLSTGNNENNLSVYVLPSCNEDLYRSILSIFFNLVYINCTHTTLTPVLKSFQIRGPLVRWSHYLRVNLKIYTIQLISDYCIPSSIRKFIHMSLSTFLCFTSDMENSLLSSSIKKNYLDFKGRYRDNVCNHFLDKKLLSYLNLNFKPNGLDVC